MLEEIIGPKTMTKLEKFSSLSAADRLLLVRAIVLLLLIRLSLSFFSFRRVQSLVSRLMRSHGRAARFPTVDRITWAVRAIGRHSPISFTCLPRALATKILLSRAGHDSTLQVGVTRDDAGKLEAHAWVEAAGEVIVGRIPSLGRFTPLARLEERML